MREIRKSTFREIRSSIGRFLAIFAIIALGVGFFAGLKVTKEAMTATVRNYLDKYEFYDYRLLSTLGFEQEDVAFFAAAPDVEAAEGSVSFDILCHTRNGSQNAIKIHSITSQVNKVKLIYGRMPQAGNECLVDSALFGEDDIGGTIYLSEDNDEEDLENFACSEYEIVGIIQSPLYLQYERGNTSLGSGRLAGYGYIPIDGFDVDYFTEIYVKFTSDFDLYSSEYKSFIDDREAEWEDLSKQAAYRRYQNIVADAGQELEDAQAEFDDKKAEGEEELADAAAELKDAEEQLADGEQALADAKKELADGEATLKEKEEELEEARTTLAEKEKELKEAQDTIAEKETELADGEKELAEGIEEWHKNDNMVESAKRELLEQMEQIDAQAQQLAQQKAGLEQMAAAGMISDEEFAAGMAAIVAGEQTIAVYKSQIDAAQAELGDADAELGEAWAEILNAQKELEDGREALADGRKELEDGQEQLADARKKLLDGQKSIDDAKAEIEEAKETLAEKEVELADAKNEYADGLKEYQDALEEFNEKIADAQAELDDARQEIEDLKEPDVYVLGRDANVGYVCFESDSDIVAGIADIFPVFFFLVAALVCITTMNRMVEEQRTQIGVLKALGYGEITIMSKYMTYSGLAAAAGCIFGYFAGTWGFPKVIWFCYGMMYNADPIFYIFNWKLAAISITVSLLCSIGTTWLSCRVELAQVAAALMRPKAPKAGKRVFLEHLPFIWKRLSFLRKVSMRNIFRYKKRLFMMIVGISGCTALLVTGFGVKDSIADVAERQYMEIQTFDLSVSFKDSADEELIKELDGLKEYGVEDYTCVMEKNMDLVTTDGIKSIIMVAGTAEAMPSFLKLHTEDGSPIMYPSRGEAVISNKLAKDYNVRVGDMIALRDESMQSLSVVITGIYENYIYNYVHISEDTWRELMRQEPERKTAYLNLAQEAISAHELSAELMKLEEVTNVTVNVDTMERISTMMQSLNVIVIVVILCAAGLAFIVLYNLTNINITERIREIATIKVLGFYKNETASYVFRENVMLTMLGMALGLVLGHFLHRFVMNEIQVDMINFNIYVKPVSFVYSGLLTMAFAWFVNKVMGGKLENISMTESLKSVD